MSINVDNQGNKISPNTDDVLFAEDLVNYILKKYSLPSVFISTEQQRKSGVSIFNSFRPAADILGSGYELKTEQTCKFTNGNNLDNIRKFISYANTKRRNILRCGAYPANVLRYCVHLAHLAATLYGQEFTEAARIAIYGIAEAMDLDVFVSQQTIQKILDQAAREREENRRLPIAKIVQPSPHTKNESSVEGIEVQISIAQERLNEREVTTENFHAGKYIGEESSKSGEDQHHVYNQKVLNSEQMYQDAATISSATSCPSQSYSGFEKMRRLALGPHNRNPCQLSSGSIGVPGSSHGEPLNLCSREHFSVDSSEHENRQRKKPRLGHDIQVTEI